GAAAAKSEAKVMDQARALAQSTDPAQSAKQLTQLKASYGEWQQNVAALVKAGQLDSPQVKSFAAKTEQSTMLWSNLTPEAQALNGAAYRDAVGSQISKDCVAGNHLDQAKVTKDNPLLQVPSLATGPSLDTAK